MAVKCKFRCVSKQEYDNGGQLWTKVILAPVWEGSTEAQLASENNIFGEATPSGELWMTLKIQAAADQFHVGKFYEIALSQIG